MDFHFVHFPYKLAINWTSGDDKNIPKSTKMTILWKNITKAINNQRKLLFLADNTASDPTRDSGERGG